MLQKKGSFLLYQIDIYRHKIDPLTITQHKVFSFFLFAFALVEISLSLSLSLSLLQGLVSIIIIFLLVLGSLS